MDPETDTYNSPFLDSDLVLISGYTRMQGVVYRLGDQRFEGKTAEEAIQKVRSDSSCVMVNRNQGSGTRILIDRLLERPEYANYFITICTHSRAFYLGKIMFGKPIALLKRVKKIYALVSFRFNKR